MNCIWRRSWLEVYRGINLRLWKKPAARQCCLYNKEVDCFMLFRPSATSKSWAFGFPTRAAFHLSIFKNLTWVLCFYFQFSQQTLAQLYHLAHLMSSGDFRTCQVICADLVRGNDFVELSPIIPALKMLISTAQQVYHRWEETLFFVPSAIIAIVLLLFTLKEWRS